MPKWDLIRGNMAERVQCIWEGSREAASLELGIWTLVGQRGNPSGRRLERELRP